MTDIPKLDTSRFELDHFYIDGQWVAPLSSAKTPLVSPNTEQVYAHVASAGEADVSRADHRRQAPPPIWGRAISSSPRSSPMSITA